MNFSITGPERQLLLLAEVCVGTYGRDHKLPPSFTSDSRFTSPIRALMRKRLVRKLEGPVDRPAYEATALGIAVVNNELIPAMELVRIMTEGGKPLADKKNGRSSRRHRPL